MGVGIVNDIVAALRTVGMPTFYDLRAMPFAPALPALSAELLL